AAATAATRRATVASKEVVGESVPTSASSAAWNRGSKRARSTATPSSLKSRYTRSFQASPSASSVPPKSNSTAVFEVVSIPRAYGDRVGGGGGNRTHVRKP